MPNQALITGNGTGVGPTEWCAKGHMQNWKAEQYGFTTFQKLLSAGEGHP